MMIPPLPRIGMPPHMPTSHAERKRPVVLLVKTRGWIIAKWHPVYDHLLDQAIGTPPSERIVNLFEILCWMPQDGS